MARLLIGRVNKGYSISSENAIYILGNYNATGVSAVGSPTPYDQYIGAEVPASIVADAVTILSENWKDGESFRSPFRLGTRVGTETTVRAALLMGDNSHQHNGAHKDGSNTYSPPTRNWVFDSSFLDPTRLPPGTPFFQFVQMTGFRQTIRQVT